jgi:hypothetical protein
MSVANETCGHNNQAHVHVVGLQMLHYDLVLVLSGQGMEEFPQLQKDLSTVRSSVAWERHHMGIALPVGMGWALINVGHHILCHRWCSHATSKHDRYSAQRPHLASRTGRTGELPHLECQWK